MGSFLCCLRMYFFDVDGCLCVLIVAVCLFVRSVVLFVLFACVSVVGIDCVLVVAVLFVFVCLWIV